MVRSSVLENMAKTWSGLKHGFEAAAGTNLRETSGWTWPRIPAEVKGVAEMAMICSKATCKAKVGMCTHEKTTAVVVLLAVSFVAGKVFGLF